MTTAINEYMKKAEENPEDYCNKMNKEVVDDIVMEIQKKYPDEITSRANTTPGGAGGSRRRRRRHRRSTRTSKKGKKYSITRRRK